MNLVTRCSKCEKDKVDEEYPQSKGKRHGRVCADCTRELKAYWYSISDLAKRRKLSTEKRESDLKAKRLRLEKEKRNRLAVKPTIEMYGSIKCNGCEIVKSNTEFPKNKQGKRHGRICSKCNAKRAVAFTKKLKAEDIEEYRYRKRIDRANRRAGITLRIPKWADVEKIKIFYKECPKGYHVDHVIPLFGKNVSGFHLSENLQYLSKEDNLLKNNKFEGYFA